MVKVKHSLLIKMMSLSCMPALLFIIIIRSK